MPAALGVSRAILDNVIFCHQEDNNWPLGEPSSLKKRFDDVFEATRYTKALDNIKSLRKERAVTLKVEKAELDGLKQDRQRADAVKDKVRKMEAELSTKEERLEQLNIEIEELTTSNKELYDRAVRFRETVQRAESLEDKKQLHEDNLNALKSTMTELKEDEAELQRRKDGFQSYLGDLKRKQDDLKRRITSKKGDLAELERLHSKQLSEKGALESDQKHHERAVRQRQETVQRISAELGMRGFDVDGLTEERVEEFADRVEDDLRQLKRGYDLLKADNKRKEDEISVRYHDLRSVLHAKEASRTTLSEDIKRLRDRVKKMQSEIENIPSADIDIEAAKREHAAQEARLMELSKEQSDAHHEGKIRDKNAEIREIDDRREELTSELNTLNRQADFRAKLDMNKKSATQKQSDIEALLSRNSEALTRFTGSSSSVEKIEDDVNTALARDEQGLLKAEEEEHEVNKRLQHFESSASFARTQLKDAQVQAQAIESEIQSALDGEYENLDDALKQCQEEIEYTNKQVALYESMSSFIKNLSTHVKDKKVCLGCNRGIDQSEMVGIEAHISDMMHKTQPVKLQGYKDDLAGWEEHLERFTNLKPSAARLEALRGDEVPKYEKELEDAQSKIRAINEEAEHSSAKVESCKTTLRELNNLRRVATDVMRMDAERIQLEKEAASIENDLRSTGSTRTGDEVQEEINGLTDRIKRFKREVQTLQQEKETLRATVTNQERNVHKAEMAVAQKTQDHERLLARQKRLEELKSEQEDQAKKLKNLENDIEASAEPLRTLGEEVERIKADAARKQGAAQNKINQLSAFARQLQESSSAAEIFTAQRGPQKLKECQEAIERIQNEIREVQDVIEATGQDVQKIEKDLNESRATERNISDNLRFIQLGREVKHIDDELRGMDLEEASRANREWNEKYNSSKRTENDLNGNAAHLNGEIASLKAQIDGRQRELRDDYKDVHKNFTHKLIEVKTAELAQNDLELYQKALNSAIMRFHSIKMEEINETLNNLWVKTYKGTDIDTIIIRADGEGTGARTYNYRVVMVKDSVEMDMRGRCSAGQKCLASILIRLALADSFSENCGIMALDEPTTNLDEHNVLALAESLGTLIEERRKQSNFQLVVITHDVNFLSQLSHSSGGIDRYFRVERDANYRSMITQETQLP